MEARAPSTPAVPEESEPKLFPELFPDQSGPLRELLIQSWNLSYNISRKYPGHEIRWAFVYEAVISLRDEGIKLYPKEPLVYDQLAYLFEHKIGHNLDAHHRYYKFRWMQAMGNVLWKDLEASHQARGVPDFDALINPDPANTNLVARVKRLSQEYKLDPIEMKAIHQEYGRAHNQKGELMLDKKGQPINCLDWRMPETHSLYWAKLGLKRCSSSSGLDKELFKLEKKIYVAMLQAFNRGRMNTPSGRTIDLARYFSAGTLSSPNLDVGGTVHLAYLAMSKRAKASEEKDLNGGVAEIGHMHFLRRLVEWLYFYNREQEAMEWLQVAVEMYPTKMTFFPGYNPKTKTYHLDQIVEEKLADNMKRGTDGNMPALMVGTLMKHYIYLAEGNEEKAKGYFDMAQRVHQKYSDKFKNDAGRMDQWRIARLRAFLIEEDSEVTDALRAKLGLGKDELPEVPR